MTEPLPLAAREAMKDAVDELGERESFRGYGPEQGYDFLREAIAHLHCARERRMLKVEEDDSGVGWWTQA